MIVKGLLPALLLTAACLAVSCGDIPVYKVDEFTPRIRANPTDADREFNEGYAWFLLGVDRMNESAAAFERAVAADPGDGQAWFFLGQAYTILGRDLLAQGAFEQAISLGGEKGGSREQRARMYHILQEWDKAATLLKEAIALNDPHPALLRYRLGVAYQMMDRLDEAVEAFETVIAVNQTAAGEYGVFHNLGGIYAQKGDREESIVWYERQVAAFDNYARIDDTYFNLGLLHYQGGEFADAAKWFALLIERNPQNALACYNLGLSYVELGRAGEAELLVDLLRGLNGELARRLNNIAAGAK